jgi:hypothetical protein
MPSDQAKRAARKAYEKEKEKSKPGEGKRFEALEKSAAASGASDPGAVAASVGRKKYGASKFARMAAKGKAGTSGKKG